MAMTMTGEVQLPASREVVWAKLNDPEVLKIRSEEHTSELQSRQYLHSFPTRRSSDLVKETPDGYDDDRGGSASGEPRSRLGKAQRSRGAQDLYPRLRGAQQDVRHGISGGRDDQDRAGESALQRQGSSYGPRPTQRVQDIR